MYAFADSREIPFFLPGTNLGLDEAGCPFSRLDLIVRFFFFFFQGHRVAQWYRWVPTAEVEGKRFVYIL